MARFPFFLLCGFRGLFTLIRLVHTICARIAARARRPRTTNPTIISDFTVGVSRTWASEAARLELLGASPPLLHSRAAGKNAACITIDKTTASGVAACGLPLKRCSALLLLLSLTRFFTLLVLLAHAQHGLSVRGHGFSKPDDDCTSRRGVRSCLATVSPRPVQPEGRLVVAGAHLPHGARLSHRTCRGRPFLLRPSRCEPDAQSDTRGTL